METGGWRTVLQVLVVFLLGISLGFFFSNRYMTGTPDVQKVSGLAEIEQGMASKPLVNRVITDLKLTEQQEFELDRILEENRWKEMKLRREIVRPRLKVLADSTRMSIEAILRPEQLDAFLDILAEMREEARQDQRMPKLE